ncbi:STAS domain-containing protein [Streptomyces acidicola]|uniref:STAS domain-containing protein n=1 Tax=Streptomyces acidicola TaxID=2596892 RepID=UPI00188321B7|nr:STAS domain-containing protein [Streptomyces acidicola]
MAEDHTGHAPCHRERTVGGTTVVELHGEIDILTAPAVTARLDSLTARPHPDLVLDLRPVTFIDCTGVGLLCRTRNRTVARDGRLRLVTDSACFRRILHGTLLSGVFEVYGHLSEALGGRTEGAALPT